jgi:hypothetical protein
MSLDHDHTIQHLYKHCDTIYFLTNVSFHLQYVPTMGASPKQKEDYWDLFREFNVERRLNAGYTSKFKVF